MLILHIDFDSFFASVAQQDNPSYRGNPIAVAGKVCLSKNPIPRSVVAASSREAKKYGVKSGMSTYQAKRLCPPLLFVPPTPERYLEVHRIFLTLLKKYTPLLEVFGIDEVFLEVTDTAQRFGGVERLVSEFKETLKDRVGEYITCSVGVSHNKLLAKLASDMDKPNGLTFIREADVPRVLGKIDLEDLCGIGPRIAARLKKLGVKTVKQLGDCPEPLLVKEFKSYGRILKLMGQGKDFSPVVPYWRKAAPKSMGHSYTLPVEINTFEKSLPILERLCEKVARRLRKQGFVGRAIHLYIRGEDFTAWGRQVSLGYPTDEGREIFRACLRIYFQISNVGRVRGDEISGNAFLGNPEGVRPVSDPTGHGAVVPPVLAEGNSKRPPLGPPRCSSKGFFSIPHRICLEPKFIRLVGVRVSELSKKYEQPLPLFDGDRRREKLIEVMDNLNDRYGEFSLFRAPLLRSRGVMKEIAGYYGRSGGK